MNGRRGAGGALALTLLLLFVLAAFGMAYLRAVTGEGHFAARMRAHAQAFRLAESALAEAVRLLREETALPGARAHSFLASARDGDALFVETPLAAALARELSGGGEATLRVTATVADTARFTPRGAAGLGRAGTLALRAEARFLGASAAAEERRDFKAARVAPPPGFTELRAELVSRFFQNAALLRALSGGSDRRARGLTVATLPAPAEGDRAPAEGGGVLYFGGSGRHRPSDGSSGATAVTLSGRISGWRKATVP